MPFLIMIHLGHLGTPRRLRCRQSKLSKAAVWYDCRRLEVSLPFFEEVPMFHRFHRLIIGQEHHYITNGIYIYIYKYYICIINIYVKHGIPQSIYHISIWHVPTHWICSQGLAFLSWHLPRMRMWFTGRKTSSPMWKRCLSEVSTFHTLSDHCIDFIEN